MRHGDRRRGRSDGHHHRTVGALTSFTAAQLPLRPFPHGTEEPGLLGDHIMGMNVLGWLTEFPVAAWGEPWMRAGALNATFSRPMVAGQRLNVTVDRHPTAMTIRYDDEDARPCVTGSATIGSTMHGRPTYEENPEVGRLHPSAHALRGALFSRLTFDFDASRDLAFLDGRPDAAQWQQRGWAHPAWIGTASNAAIMRHIDFDARDRFPGRWLQLSINVGSTRPIEDGARVQMYSRIDDISTTGRAGQLQVAHLVCSLYVGEHNVAHVDNAFVFADTGPQFEE